jgi:beta-glucosidase
MCAYNKVNGVRSCENPQLLGMLKKDWGYRGFVMSDPGAVHSTARPALVGFDQQSGWPSDKERHHGAPLQAAIARGELPAARLDDMARRIARAMFAAGIVDDPVKPGAGTPFAGHARFAQAVAEGASTLLKSNRDVLPLNTSWRLPAATLPATCLGADAPAQ